MRKRIVLLIILLFTLSVFGCSTDINSNELIIDSEIIDAMSIGVVAREGEVYYSDVIEAGVVYTIDFKNEGQVNEMLNLLKNIRLKKLSLDQIQEIFKSHEIWAQKVNYKISLRASSERVDSSTTSKGILYVLEEEKLIFIDPRTIGVFEDEQLKKTDFYISKEKQTEVIGRIVKMIDESKDTN